MTADAALKQTDVVAHRMLEAMDMENTPPGVCFLALATLMGLVVGSSSIPEERACQDVQEIVRATAKVTREKLKLHPLQKAGSERSRWESNGGSDKVH